MKENHIQIHIPTSPGLDCDIVFYADKDKKTAGLKGGFTGKVADVTPSVLLGRLPKQLSPPEFIESSVEIALYQEDGKLIGLSIGKIQVHPHGDVRISGEYLQVPHVDFFEVRIAVKYQL